jgi:hypothetical protein
MIQGIVAIIHTGSVLIHIEKMEETGIFLPVSKGFDQRAGKAGEESHR